MQTLLEILQKYHEGLLAGIWVTFKLCLVIWGSGLVIGGVWGGIAARFPHGAGRPLQALSLLASATPILVILFWLHYPAQALLDIVVDPFITASVALGSVNIVAVAEIVRDGISRLPKEYSLAARVCGLNSRATFFQIQLPLLFRQITPGLLSSQVYILQATLFASLISVDEIFRVAQRINAVEYRPVEIYTTLALFFLAICLPLRWVAVTLERRYQRDLRAG